MLAVVVTHCSGGGIQIVIYLKPDRMHAAPTVLQMGHIVRLHRVQMQSYQGKAQGFVAGNNQGVSFTILDGFPTDGDEGSMVPLEFGVINSKADSHHGKQYRIFGPC